MKAQKKMAWLVLLGVILLAFGWASVAFRAEATAYFAAYQSVDVTASGRSGLYGWEYADAIHPAAYLGWLDNPAGNYSGSFALDFNRWYGFFVYDYNTSKWEEAFYVYKTTL